MRKNISIFFVVLMLAAIGFGVVSSFTGEDADATGGNSGGLWQRNHVENHENLPDLDLDDWSMKLVNADNPVEDDFYVPTGTTADGYLFDSRAVSALDELLDAGHSEGLQLALTSAYRSYEYQDMLFQSKVSELIPAGNLSRDDAERAASREVARPGTSEHNIGLAADIVCEYYGILDDGYADTAEAKWLREHCAEYGFILRYDEDKQDITGVIYEPWHFRYVGKVAAQYIMENDLCLEEFLALYA